MKCLCIFFISIKDGLKGIHLVDRCLILFMIVLLLQSAYSLFFKSSLGSESGSIDVIVRTSSAAIFGYFLSANFIRHASPTEKKKKSEIKQKELEEIQSSVLEDSKKGQIGFLSSTKSGTKERGEAEALQEIPEVKVAGKLQIVTATAIGLFCLIVLLLLRNVSQWKPDISETSSMTATVAQFRDFVSGCVGFLIGCPTDSSNQNNL